MCFLSSLILCFFFYCLVVFDFVFPFFWLFIFCHTLVYLQCHFIFVFSPFLEKGVWDYNCDIGILIGYLLNISGGPVDRFDQWYPSENRVTLIQTWLIVRWASSVWCNKIDREWCYDAFLYATFNLTTFNRMNNCTNAELFYKIFTVDICLLIQYFTYCVYFLF